MKTEINMSRMIAGSLALIACGILLNAVFIYFELMTPAEIGFYVFIMATSVWVYWDATKIGIKDDSPSGKTESLRIKGVGPFGWAFCCLVVWIVAFPLYLIKRPGYKKHFLQTPPALGSTSTLVSPLSKTQVALAGAAPPPDFDQQLRQLAKLKQDGIISSEEFEQKKKALLGL
jgi:hypothetical protein